ncbi:MAG TPA: pantetheine-phosphate adenylyltransferase [Oscillospiraceae bacterium]|nr:pantetheine-phosphate adenylyltransferase [Oscillospiraceae bacterium]
MKIAVCPGSFDPVTYGHLDIVRRAAALFDEVIILVVTNPDKHCVFTAEERCDMIRRVVGNLPNVKVDSHGGLLADYCRKHGAAAIVKGLRAVSDFEYEFQMALANKKLLPDADTVFLTTNAENMYLSSSLVRQIASLGGDISPFVPEEIREEIRIRLQGQKTQEE